MTLVIIEMNETLNSGGEWDTFLSILSGVYPFENAHYLTSVFFYIVKMDRNDPIRLNNASKWRPAELTITGNSTEAFGWWQASRCYQS